MAAETVRRFMTDTLPGVETVEAAADTYVFVGRERRMPFATLVTGDRHETVSRLDRPDNFRLNIGVSKKTYQTLFGPDPARLGEDGLAATGHDFAALDQIMPQPALVSDYVEGGSFDMLIVHRDNAILVKLSANVIPGALHDVRAVVLFLATATLGNQEPAFREAFYDQTVGVVYPELVVPIHWGDFFTPLSEQLDALDPEDVTTGFDFLIEQLVTDDIGFGIMQGFGRIVLFAE